MRAMMMSFLIMVTSCGSMNKVLYPGGKDAAKQSTYKPVYPTGDYVVLLDCKHPDESHLGITVYDVTLEDCKRFGNHHSSMMAKIGFACRDPKDSSQNFHCQKVTKDIEKAVLGIKQGKAIGQSYVIYKTFEDKMASTIFYEGKFDEEALCKSWESKLKANEGKCVGPN